MIFGGEAAGTVEALGEGVTGFKKGDRVAIKAGQVDSQIL
jgi:NADPH:quinone reductase-like Zn-dependent oxidoreductase